MKVKIIKFKHKKPFQRQDFIEKKPNKNFINLMYSGKIVVLSKDKQINSDHENFSGNTFARIDAILKRKLKKKKYRIWTNLSWNKQYFYKTLKVRMGGGRGKNKFTALYLKKGSCLLESQGKRLYWKKIQSSLFKILKRLSCRFCIKLNF